MKKTNIPAEAQGVGVDKTNRFALGDIGFTDLDGNRIKLNFDQKEFGNLLFSNATSIEMDAVSKLIHAKGEAEATEDVLQQIDAIVQYASKYNHRVKTAISEYVNKLISGGK